MCQGAAMKRALLVNGVPASGKTTVAQAAAQARDWPLLALDTIKEAFFDHLGTGDRDFNRLLGKASYQAIFASIADFPAGTTTVIDAWFGFQSREILEGHLARAGITQVAEIWCHAPAEIIGARYRARLEHRHAGHLGEAYVPELVKLAGSARALGGHPLLDIETTHPLDATGLAKWLAAVFP
jgi:glucokinase